MLPDDDSYRQVQKYRARELLIGALLFFFALSSNIVYALFLRSLGLPLLITLMATEWIIMIVVYLMIVSKMRKRGQ